MLTLRRFRELAGSYGGDLKRWPEDVRGDARALLSSSPQARACLDDARVLDHAIAAAQAPGDAAARRISEDDAALARLRSGVSARIAAPARRRFAATASQSPGGRIAARLDWVGMAMGAGLAVIAGSLIGTSYVPAPASDAVLGMLQPIHILAEQ